MNIGHVRDYFARVMLTLPGLVAPLSVEFILDTGFEGQLTLPMSAINALQSTYVGNRRVLLADGSLRDRPSYTTTIDWDDQERMVEIMLLEGSPLLGVELLAEMYVQIEMTDGGEVSIESL
jgi:clan AA aspartic protease